MTPNGTGKAVDPATVELVNQELERILASPGFCHSQQSQRLLRRLVEGSLEGKFEELRERVLAVELFGRPAGFDANEDPIVRVRANEVRKRLARYYESLSEPGPIRLELPVGGYRVEFRLAESLPDAAAATAAGPQTRRKASWWRIAAAATVLLAAVALVAVWYPGQPIDRFWAPLLATSGRVIVCTGHPVVYRLSTELWDAHSDDFLGRQTVVRKLKPEDRIEARHIIPIEDQYTGLGSAHAMARVSAWLAMRGKTADIRFGDDLSFTDLKQSPAVLIGFANRWTIDFTRRLRFTPELIAGRSGVRDKQTGKTWVLPNLKENGRTDEDYVLVSRTFYSESGQCLITVAGLTQYGTQAGGELISDPAQLNRVLGSARPGWEKRNLQMLFHVRVVGHAPGTPVMIAMHEW